MLESAKTTRIDLSGWKMIIGGAALPQALAREALELGLDIYGGYGMSETCPILTLSGLMPKMTSWAFERQLEIRCKPGRPLPLTQLRIVDGEMNDLPHDGKTSGELVVRAPWHTQGYLKDPKGSEKLWAGGWLHTGDVATKRMVRGGAVTGETLSSGPIKCHVVVPRSSTTTVVRTQLE